MCVLHSIHLKLIVQISRAALSIQVPAPWPKQCPYKDRNERSVIATLVNTNWHLYMLIISGGQLWDQSMGMFSPHM